MSFFEILKKDAKSRARSGVLNTAHGQVHTPAFLPIGTRGSVKAVTAEELKFWGAEMILANTYHLWLRPGDALINKAGGLHKFIGWDGPILTDSGGFQVFSLGEKARKRPINGRATDPTNGSMPIYRPILKKISEAGVEFQNELDGRSHLLSPEISIQIQSNLGSDIALVLDDVPGLPATKSRIQKSLDLTIKWAKRAKAHFDKIRAGSINPGQRLFGIVQGGDFEDLRKQSIKALQEIGFDGYGIGGLAVGEEAEVLYKVLGFTVPHLEEEKPRHLLGVGYPEQIIRAVSLGIDMFDCVLPTRNARHGQLFVTKKNALSFSKEGEGGSSSYEIITITNNKFVEDFTPVDNTCNCYGCLHHNRAYLRHLFMTKEPLALRLATMHNLRFYLNLMEKIRRAIEYGGFEELMGILGSS
ncbi:MAG: tRNA guanosine(34) transglycosylase Tgt [Candidatus Doudnabacteria bacterium]|nr:tRNA guanosine(34) transglycosylase Tgt [Candidatus Doudnabacteria bacterium]